MTKFDKLLLKVLSGNADNNIKFKELVNILKGFGFELRVKGSHYIFYKDEIEEIINIQSKRGKAKPYQVKQVRDLLIKYKFVEHE